MPEVRMTIDPMADPEFRDGLRRLAVNLEGLARSVRILIGDEPAKPVVDLKPFGRRYDGPIEVGQIFIWEPLKPHAWARVEVIRIEDRAPYEKRIHTRTLRGQSRDQDRDYWNDESRFREACWQGPEPKTEFESVRDLGSAHDLGIGENGS